MNKQIFFESIDALKPMVNGVDVSDDIKNVFNACFESNMQDREILSRIRSQGYSSVPFKNIAATWVEDAMKIVNKAYSPSVNDIPENMYDNLYTQALTLIKDKLMTELSICKRKYLENVYSQLRDVTKDNLLSGKYNNKEINYNKIAKQWTEDVINELQEMFTIPEDELIEMRKSLPKSALYYIASRGLDNLKKAENDFFSNYVHGYYMRLRYK